MSMIVAPERLEEELPALLEEAWQFAKRSSHIPGITSPYTASSLISMGRRYYCVTGRDTESRSRLIEVFVVKPTGDLEALPTFLYPEPIRERFATDLSVLFAPDPWRCEVSDLTTTQIANGLMAMSLYEQCQGKRRRKRK